MGPREDILFLIEVTDRRPTDSYLGTPKQGGKGVNVLNCFFVYHTFNHAHVLLRALRARSDFSARVQTQHRMLPSRARVQLIKRKATCRRRV